MTWSKNRPEQFLFERDEFLGDDAYFQWRRKTAPQWRLDLDDRSSASDDDDTAKWKAVLIYSESITADQFARGEGIVDVTDGTNESIKRTEWQKNVRVPLLYRRPPGHLQGTTYFTALVDDQFFDWLSTNERVQHAIYRISVHQFPKSIVSASGTEPESVERSKQEMKDTDAVVVGIIDYGIAFAHERFRSTEMETRIKFLWSQDDSHIDGGRVDYGRELREEDIKKLLSEQSPQTDEDVIYRRAASENGLKNLVRSISGRAAHGTHVMDVACGYDFTNKTEGRPELSKRPIICVQLPFIANADTSGSNLDSFALDGIRYILDRAEKIAPGRPVVINFSFGDVAGSHDGASSLEAAIDELIDTHPSLDVVLPAGNSHLGRLRARVLFRPPETSSTRGIEPSDSQEERKDPIEISRELHWRVLPDDRTASFMEIWLPESPSPDEGGGDPDGGRIELSIKPPDGSEFGEKITNFNRRQVMQWKPGDEVLCEARYAYLNDLSGAPGSKGRGMFLIALPPTFRADGKGPIAPAGTWNVRLVCTKPHEIDVAEVWIQRDDTPFGFPRRGRQSFFEDPNYERFDQAGREIEVDNAKSTVRRSGSMNAIATGRNTVVVGGSPRKEGRAAKYSAGGRISGVHRFGPDVLAPSDESIVRRGILAAGTRSGSVVALNGTSVAVPQWTRWLVEQRSARKPGSRRAADVLAQNAQLANGGNSPVPTIRGGAGPVEFPQHRRKRLKNKER